MGQYDLYIKGAKLIKERFPALWYICCPRHYVPPNGYPNIKVAGASIAAQLMASVELTKEQMSKPTIDCIILSWRLAENGVPTFFIGNDIITDLAQSEPPSDLTLNELQWPHDAMIFMLPEQFQRAYFRRYVPFVAIARAPTGLMRAPKIVNDVLPGAPPIGIEHPGEEAMIFTAPIFFSTDKPVDYSGSWPTRCTVGDLINSPLFIDGTNENELGYMPEGSELSREEDIALTTKIFCVALWLLMLLNSEPQHVEIGSVTCVRKKKQRDSHAHGPDDLWAPNFIGRAYTHSESQGGTHASPRAHPRRGHWTHQVHGPGRSLRKLKWLRRTMVGVKV